MKRYPVKMIKQEYKINDHTITSYRIVWNTTDTHTPVTRVYLRLHGGYGVVCYCPAHQYRKTCYHKRLACEFVRQALTQPTQQPTTDTPPTKGQKK